MTFDSRYGRISCTYRSPHDIPNIELQITAALRKALDYTFSIQECQDAARNVIQFMDAEERERQRIGGLKRLQREADAREAEYQHQMRHAIDQHVRQHQQLKEAM